MKEKQQSNFSIAFILYHNYFRIKSNNCKVAIFSLLILFASQGLIAQSVSTFAGNGFQGGSNGTVSTCEFYMPEQMAFDSHGNLYIVDAGLNMIRKIDPLGNVTNYAGTGVAGYLNGNISTAQFSSPLGIAIDQFDNIFVSDESNYVIRKIDTLGNVSTFAGNGIQGYVDGVDSLASFSSPAYLCLDDSSNLYVADRLNNVIRKIDLLGNVSTLAGTGLMGNLDGPGNTATFNSPISIAYDKLHHVFYVSDRDNNLIRKIDSLHNVSTYAGDGLAGHADGVGVLSRFSEPKGLITDSIGNLFVAGRFDYTIRKIDTMANVTTIAGLPNNPGYVDGNTSIAQFGRPISVVFNQASNLLVSDYDNYVIRGVEVYSITSVNDIEQSSNSHTVYPNPSSGQFTIVLPTDNAEIIITDILGQPVLKAQTNQKTISLQVDNNGVYIVYVKTEQGTSTSKLIIKK